MTLPAAGSSFRWWARELAGVAAGPQVLAELPWWQSVAASGDLLAGLAADGGRDGAGTARSLTVALPPGETAPLLTSVPAAFHAGVDDVLLAALAVAVAGWRARGAASEVPAAGGVLVEVEGHGRAEELVEGADLSQAVGWFTTLYPVRLDPGPFDMAEFLAGGPAAGRVLKRVKEQLRAVPGGGIGYGLLRYLRPGTGPALAAGSSPALAFNYLGRFTARQSVDWDIAPEPIPAARPTARRRTRSR